jgi:proteasome lid subunit RPN8/RPN11
MKLKLRTQMLDQIERHGERSYPLEGAGVLLGILKQDIAEVQDILPMKNSFDADEQYHRYQIDGRSMMKAELIAEQRHLEVIGIFHSHPDHPAEPSAFDLEHSLPWFTYVITRVIDGRADRSRAWRLQEDRAKFNEVKIILDTEGENE